MIVYEGEKDMKKEYVRPVIVGERFAPNEYIAACGDRGKVYKFECNAGSKHNSYNVYLEDGTPYATSGRDYGGCKTDFYSYSPCGGKHDADSDSGFLPGYMYRQNVLGNNTGDRIDVIIWTDNYTQVHCTTNLKMSEWETAKS